MKSVADQRCDGLDYVDQDGHRHGICSGGGLGEGGVVILREMEVGIDGRDPGDELDDGVALLWEGGELG